jgi:hypothetical protein
MVLSIRNRRPGNEILNYCRNLLREEARRHVPQFLVVLHSTRRSGRGAEPWTNTALDNNCLHAASRGVSPRRCTHTIHTRAHTHTHTHGNSAVTHRNQRGASNNAKRLAALLLFVHGQGFPSSTQRKNVFATSRTQHWFILTPWRIYFTELFSWSWFLVPVISTVHHRHHKIPP